MDAHTSPTSSALVIPEHTKHADGYCSYCHCDMSKCKGTPARYKSLYEMLDRFQFILANNAEDHVECNEPMYEALREGMEEDFYNGKMAYNYLNDNVLWRKLTPEEEEMTGSEFIETLSDEDREKVQDAISDADYPDIYQTYVVDNYGAEVLKDYGQTVWFNEDMQLWFWGVHHCGTAWSHVMSSVYPVRNKDYYEKR